jgi:hypothetical protein
MMLRRQSEQEHRLNTQECSEYTPIQAAKADSLEFGVAVTEDAGCDSCTHYHNGECGVYRSVK